MPGSFACGDFERGKMSRRSLLTVGGLSFLGLSLPGALRARAASTAPRARADAVIFLHQWGGPSHVDTFDMKPGAPEAIRGEFKPIATRTPGITCCERLPRMAQVLHHFAQVRSLHHEMKNHNSAGYYSLSGAAPATDDIRLRDSPELF